MISKKIMTIAILIIVTFVITSSTLYTFGFFERESNVNVEKDSTASIGLQSPDESNAGGNGGEFVTITNNFDEQTTFDINLENKTATYDLKYGGQEKDSITVTLSTGSSATIDIIAENSGGSKQDTVKYSVSATHTSFAANLVRTQPVSKTGGGGGGPCDNPNPPPWCNGGGGGGPCDNPNPPPWCANTACSGSNTAPWCKMANTTNTSDGGIP